MAVKYYDLNFESRRTYLGGVGYFDENEYRALRINVASVLEDYPSASFKVVFQRAKDSHPYEKAQSDVTLLGDKLVVTLNETDYNMPGRLLVQVTFVSGEVTGKSGIFIADVGKSLSSDTTDPQSPYADALKEIDDALEKIDDFLETGGGAISPEMIEEAVSNYLETNPIMETDPTVPAWAKAESKPSYSYNELTDKPTIPAAYTLPVANASMLGGVKPISKTDDMTQGVGVDSEGKLWALPGGGESTGGGSGGIPMVTAEGNGLAYTATIPGITELYNGLTIVVVFGKRVSNADATLDLNGLGAFVIKGKFVKGTTVGDTIAIPEYAISDGIPVMMMYDAKKQQWVVDATIVTHVSAGGTGRKTLASGSYLVGNGTELVNLKTPAQVLADILPSTAADAGKVPTVQANGTIALAEVSGGGGEAAWNTICEGLIPEQVASIVINSDADGNLLSTLDVNELLVYGHVYLTGSSKVRIEMNGLWTSGNYAETDSQLGAWMAGFVIHCRRVGNGIIRTVEGMKNAVLNAFSGKIESVELHASTNEIYFAAGTDAKQSTVINAYYR